jgi:transposase
MIFPSNRVRIMVATKPVDFRKGHDGLAALVKNELHKDPFTGTVFVFRSRKADRLKLSYWDGSGLVMACKRLERLKSVVCPKRTSLLIARLRGWAISSWLKVDSMPSSAAAKDA